MDLVCTGGGGFIVYKRMRWALALKPPASVQNHGSPIPLYKDLRSSAQNCANFYLWQKVTQLCLLSLSFASCILLLAVNSLSTNPEDNLNLKIKVMKIIVSTSPFSKNAEATYVTVINNKVKNFVVNNKYASLVGIPAGSFAIVEYTMTKSPCGQFDNIKLTLIAKITGGDFANLVLSED